MCPVTDSTWYRVGWIIDGTGGPIRPDVLVEVKEGVFTSFEPTRDERIISRPHVDLSGYTILPPLVDCHVHLTMSGSGEPSLRKRQLVFSLEEARGTISTHLRRHLLHGVLAVRDGGDRGGHTLQYKRECLHPQNRVQSVRSAGRAWHAPGRYGTLIGRPPGKGEPLAHAVSRGDGGADHVKIVQSGLNSLTEFGKETPPQFELEELKAAVRTSAALGRKTMVHANGREPVRLAVLAGCSSIEHGFFMGKENLGRMADRQTVWVPTAFTMRAYAENLKQGGLEAQVARKTLDHQLEQIRAAREMGVPLAVGTDAGSLGVHHGSALAEELGLLMEGGIPVEEAVRCATSNGVGLLGLGDVFGVIRTGAPASFLAVRGDPSRFPGSLRVPEGVFVRGLPLLGQGANLQSTPNRL